MTLLVDRRKDNYDDLLMLARDARANRARVNRWTAGLVIGAMTAMGIYVATVNTEVDQLRNAAKDAGRELADVQNERNALAAQVDAMSRFEDLYKNIAPAFVVGERFKDIAVNVSGTPNIVTPQGAPAAPQFTLSNLVWIVDGSRRFPLTSGDILWVPEGKFWVRMEEPESGRKPISITLRKGNKPVEESTPGIGHTFSADSQDSANSFEIKTKDSVQSGVANCVKLTYHEDSNRTGFDDEEWVDIEVLFRNNPNCPERQFPD